MLDLRILIAPDGASTITVSAPTGALLGAAPRYHSGGIAGLAPHEIPAILSRGEFAKKLGLAANVTEGTVTDHRTGLMWSADDVTPKGCKHGAAIKACEALRLGGHSDWRLPTRAELLTLADDTRHAPAINIEAFPSCKSAWYWTSTITAWSSDYAWLVSFYLGYANYSLRVSSSGLVRAVRSVAPGQ